MTQASDIHDTSWMEMALQRADMDDITREARERDYCIQCNRAVRSEDYGWKFIGVGGFLTGPFCGTACQFAWLNESDNDE